ncbi:hypothetical protein CPC16_006336 [Podila verticillata]|nr:hypothetical protein CPC16_006336 [Podila verticillata]
MKERNPLASRLALYFLPMCEDSIELFSIQLDPTPFESYQTITGREQLFPFCRRKRLAIERKRYIEVEHCIQP